MMRALMFILMVLTIVTVAPAMAIAKPKPVHVETGKGRIQPAPADPYLNRYLRIPRYVRAAFDRIGQCESTGNIRINTGNGFYGYLQFTLQTWRTVAKMPGMPHQASKAAQVWAGWITARIQGWPAWPKCSIRAGATSINIHAANLTKRPH